MTQPSSKAAAPPDTMNARACACLNRVIERSPVSDQLIGKATRLSSECFLLKAVGIQAA